LRCERIWGGIRRALIAKSIIQRSAFEPEVVAMTILNHIESLEAYCERAGATLVRTKLPREVQGLSCRNLITLRAGLSPEQELLTLVHELTHLLLHRETLDGMERTRFEYEAEAVEALVMQRLGLPHPLRCVHFEGESPTDNLLSSSVARVIWASRRICGALGLDGARSLEAKAPVHLEAAAREEIVFEYEHHGVGNFPR
jgi:hypothetical protein